VQLLRDVICAGQEELYDYVWCWLAHLFQRPWELPGTALVLRGKQGLGKNQFVDTIGRLIGMHYIPVSDMGHIAGRFSGHLADVLLVFANEALWGGNRVSIGPLKAMITDEYTAIERKGKDVELLPNCKRLIVAGNDDYLVNRDLDDRRFVILEVADDHKEDHAYFAALQAELQQGGYEALLYELLHVDLGDWHPRRLPVSLRRAGWDMKVRSAPSPVQWWLTCLQQGYVIYGEQVDWPLLPIAKPVVYHQYLNWCDRLKIMHPVHDTVFGKVLKDFGVRSNRPQDFTLGGARPRCYLFPPWEQACKTFVQVTNIPVDEEDDSN
jgi:hypothetical protein